MYLVVVRSKRTPTTCRKELGDVDPGGVASLSWAGLILKRGPSGIGLDTRSASVYDAGLNTGGTKLFFFVVHYFRFFALFLSYSSLCLFSLIIEADPL